MYHYDVAYVSLVYLFIRLTKGIESAHKKCVEWTYEVKVALCLI